MDLAQGSTKVKIWYITQWLIDFSTPGKLPALSMGEREGVCVLERERVKERERGSESSTLCSTKSDSLTGFTGSLAGTAGLCDQ